MKVVYSDTYEVSIGAHVFPTVKFRLIRERLLREKLIPEKDFICAPYASSKDILLVHTKSYLDKLTQGTLSPQELFALELPYSKELIKASRICVGGTILAAKLILQGEGVCVHLGGGFHHAFADHGEGFCVLNDVACAAEFCRRQRRTGKIMIIDCDLHQGNGSADIFKDCKEVFTFSIHQENNYPFIKPPGDLDIGLADGAGDNEYISCLEEHLPSIFQSFRPQLVFYLAGADPYFKDQLGGLALTLQGLVRRDEYIFRLAKKNGVAVVVVLAGGYASAIDDTVTIHYNMVKKALEIFD